MAAKKKKTPPDAQVLALAWYRKDEWDLLRKISEDSDNIEDTYAEWVAIASARFAEARSTGLSVMKVDIDTRELLAWCRDRGCAVNGESRAHFAAIKAAQQHREGQP